jgi:hypothetical protein
MAYLWTNPVTRLTVIGSKPPGDPDMPFVEIADGLDPSEVWLDKTGAAAPVPPRPSVAMFFDAVLGEWLDERSEDEAFTELRAQRDALLKASDWTQMADAPLTDQERAAWRAYRQELRDLPSKTRDPRNPEWPTAPASTNETANPASPAGEEQEGHEK